MLGTTFGANCATFDPADNRTCLVCSELEVQYGPTCEPCPCNTARGQCSFGIQGNGMCKSCIREGKWYGLYCQRTLPYDVNLVGENEMIMCMILFALVWWTMSLRVWFALHPHVEKAPAPVTPEELFRAVSMRRSEMRQQSIAHSTRKDSAVVTGGGNEEQTAVSSRGASDGPPRDPAGRVDGAPRVNGVGGPSAAPRAGASAQEVYWGYEPMPTSSTEVAAWLQSTGAPACDAGGWLKEEQPAQRSTSSVASSSRWAEERRSRASSVHPNIRPQTARDEDDALYKTGWRMGPGGTSANSGGSSVAPRRHSAVADFGTTRSSSGEGLKEPGASVLIRHPPAESIGVPALPPQQPKPVRALRSNSPRVFGEDRSVDRPNSPSPPPQPPSIPIPKFSRGAEVRRNAAQPDTWCDFGGHVGAVLCGEVVVIDSVVSRRRDGGSVWYAYGVVGGSYLTAFDVEELFELA